MTQGAFAADGTINFTGEITDATCSISPSSQNLTVPLGKVAKTVLNGAAGKKSAAANFTIDLLDCPATAKNATVAFTGVADAVNKDDLRIANAGQVGVSAATGVAVQLGDSTGTQIAVNGLPSAEYKLGEGANSLKFQAQYVSTGAAVTVGPANTSAQFTVAYK